MLITHSFLIFTLLSRKSKTEAQTRKLTFCLTLENYARSELGANGKWLLVLLTLLFSI